jgi:copper resistance protein B
MSAMDACAQSWRVGISGAAIALALFPLVALAQVADHSTMPMPTTPEPTPDAQPATAATPASPAAAMDHAAMDHAAMGHDMDAMPTAAAGQPTTPVPEITDADRAAAIPPPTDHPVHDNGIYSYLQFNRLEGWDANPGTGLAWEGQGWVGTDLDRLWLRSEGEQLEGDLHSADLEALYGHAISPWWDLVAGIRHDFKPGASRDFFAIGVIGLTPYKFEVSATAYIGPSGQGEARIEAEYDVLLGNRLILQPQVEVNVFGRDDARRGIGSGLGTVETGLRLRYEFTRRFAPYVGVVHERAFGRTADLRRAGGESAGDTRLVVGLRTWF